MRVAIICAYNPRNSGMYSVDLAAFHFFTRNGIEFELFCAQHERRKETWSFGNLRFRVLRDPYTLKGFTHLVYWGDFINNVNYALSDFTRWELKFGYARSRDEAFSNWMRLFLLDGDGPRPWTVISVSNNFQDLSHDLPAPLVGRISELYNQNFDAIFPRDGYSLRNLLAHYPGAARGRVWGGIDAALLCRPRDFPLARQRWHSRRSFTFFFGRSKFKNTEELIRRIARETRLRPVHLKRWFSLTPKFAHWQYLRSLKQIRDSQFVLSDAYHCCINAMNRERPAFGVGRLERAQTGTVSDFKKKELFSTHELDDHYTTVTSPELSESNMCSIVEKACAVMDDPGFAERRYAMLRAQRAEYEALLLMALRS